MARKPTVCAGFPQRGGCSNPPGTPWTPYWCGPCDEKRRASLSAQFDAIAAKMGLSTAPVAAAGAPDSRASEAPSDRA